MNGCQLPLLTPTDEHGPTGIPQGDTGLVVANAAVKSASCQWAVEADPRSINPLGNRVRAPTESAIQFSPSPSDGNRAIVTLVRENRLSPFGATAEKNDRVPDGQVLSGDDSRLGELTAYMPEPEIGCRIGFGTDGPIGAASPLESVPYHAADVCRGEERRSPHRYSAERIEVAGKLPT
jgi:hypothetical protein